MAANGKSLSTARLAGLGQRFSDSTHSIPLNSGRMGLATGKTRPLEEFKIDVPESEGEGERGGRTSFTVPEKTVIVSPTSPQYFKRLAGIQIVILLLDLLCTTLAEEWRYVSFSVAAISLLQALLVILNVVLLFIGFTNTFPFKAGLIRLVAEEFSATMCCAAGYFAILAAVRGLELRTILSCTNSQECDLWSPMYRALYVAFRIAAVVYYFTFKRAVVRLCEPKFHKDSSWLRSKLPQGR